MQNQPSSLLATISGEPVITRRDRETLYEWPDVLTVFILADGAVGQFTGAQAWSRREVEEALAQRSSPDTKAESD